MFYYADTDTYVYLTAGAFDKTFNSVDGGLVKVQLKNYTVWDFSGTVSVYVIGGKLATDKTGLYNCGKSGCCYIYEGIYMDSAAVSMMKKAGAYFSTYNNTFLTEIGGSGLETDIAEIDGSTVLITNGKWDTKANGGYADSKYLSTYLKDGVQDKTFTGIASVKYTDYSYSNGKPVVKTGTAIYDFENGAKSSYSGFKKYGKDVYYFENGMCFTKAIGTRYATNDMVQLTDADIAVLGTAVPAGTTAGTFALVAAGKLNTKKTGLDSLTNILGEGWKMSDANDPTWPETVYFTKGVQDKAYKGAASGDLGWVYSGADSNHGKKVNYYVMDGTVATTLNGVYLIGKNYTWVKDGIVMDSTSCAALAKGDFAPADYRNTRLLEAEDSDNPSYVDRLVVLKNGVMDTKATGYYVDLGSEDGLRKGGYFKNGALCKSLNPADYAGAYNATVFYIGAKGKASTGTTLALFMENGYNAILNTSAGKFFADYKGTIYCFNGGICAQKAITYYVADDVYCDFDYTLTAVDGIVTVTAKNVSALNTATGETYAAGDLVVVTNGKLDTKATGLFYYEGTDDDPSGIYYFENGIRNNTYTGIAKGSLNWNSTNVTESDMRYTGYYVNYYVSDGEVTLSGDGLQKIGSDYYWVYKGMVMDSTTYAALSKAPEISTLQFRNTRLYYSDSGCSIPDYKDKYVVLKNGKVDTTANGVYIDLSNIDGGGDFVNGVRKERTSGTIKTTAMKATVFYNDAKGKPATGTAVAAVNFFVNYAAYCNCFYWNYNGFLNYNGKACYFTNGIYAEKTITYYDGGGNILTLSAANGIVTLTENDEPAFGGSYVEGDMVCLTAGKVDTKKTGMVENVKNAGQYYYVVKGVYQKDYNSADSGLVKAALPAYKTTKTVNVYVQNGKFTLNDTALNGIYDVKDKKVCLKNGIALDSSYIAYMKADTDNFDSWDVLYYTAQMNSIVKDENTASATHDKYVKLKGGYLDTKATGAYGLWRAKSNGAEDAAYVKDGVQSGSGEGLKLRNTQLTVIGYNDSKPGSKTMTIPLLYKNGVRNVGSYGYEDYTGYTPGVYELEDSKTPTWYYVVHAQAATVNFNIEFSFNIKSWDNYNMTGAMKLTTASLPEKLKAALPAETNSLDTIYLYFNQGKVDLKKKGSVKVIGFNSGSNSVHIYNTTVTVTNGWADPLIG